MKPYSDDLRGKIINVWQKQEDSPTNIAKRFDVDRATVYRYIKQYKATGSSMRRRRPKNHNTKLDLPVDFFLEKQIKKKPEITLEELRNKVDKKFGVSVTIMTISRHLRKIKLTRKKKQNIPKSKIR